MHQYTESARKTYYRSMCCDWCYLINEDLGDDMDIIQPEHLGSCIKSVTNHEETILQVDLTDNDDVKEYY